MNLKKCLVSAAMATAMLWCGTGVAGAQNPDRITYFTFSQPVTIPGATLPAGRYQFKILQSFSDRGILRIDSPDGSKHFATILAVPTTRTDVAPAPELRFLETAASAPPALGSYWMPGSGMGWEFVYPKDQATTLAINTKQPLLTGPRTSSTSAESMSASGLTRTTASGETPYVANTAPRPASGGVLRGSSDSEDSSVQSAANAENNRNSSAAASPRANNMAGNSAAAQSRDTNTAQSNSVSGMSGSDSASSNRTRLPATAGISPAAALAGILALAAAFGLGVWRRRVA